MPWSWDNTTLLVLWKATSSSSALRSSFSSRITSSVKPATVVSEVCVSHFLLQGDVLLHAGLQKRLRVVRVPPVACSTKIVVLGKTVTFSAHRLHAPVRVLRR